MQKITLLALILFAQTLFGQNPEWDAARIRHEMEKLNTVGNVLYLAAHPDDENTRLITWLANEKKVRAAYLSLTRGDGGQNLIGDEKGPLMGLVRTQELMEARNNDGGEQFFTRALDFGYSKTAGETFEKWNRDSILADVVYTIRQFKPDVIVTRFPPNGYAGHGHHTASAMLADEAFEAAADPTQFSASAEKFGAWQVKRLFFNASSWWDKDIAERADEYVTVNVGKYNPLLGKEYTVIAAESRSQHRSQGFGDARDRGESIEYLELRKGDEVKSNSMFEDIDLSWDRVKGSRQVQKMLDKALESYDPQNPDASIPALTNIYFAIKELRDFHQKEYKLNQCKELIAACGGFWFEFLAEKDKVASNTEVPVKFEAISQLNSQLKLKEIKVGEKSWTVNEELGNEVTALTDTLKVADQKTVPYWLWSDPEHNMFPIPVPEWRNMPETPAVFQADFIIETEKGDIPFTRDIRYKWVSRKDGELYKPFHIIPQVTVTPDEKTVLFGSMEPKEVTVKVKTYNAPQEKVIVKPQLPEGWTAEPEYIEKKDVGKGQTFFATFTLFPTEGQGNFEMNFLVNGEKAHDIKEIDYRHIENQLVTPKASINLVRADIKTVGDRIGYIMGSGDEVPTALEQMGYSVDILDPERLTLDVLNDYSSVVLGVRVYNTTPAIIDLHGTLNKYVKQGGNLVVQYNKSYGLISEEIGPYDLKIGRSRVTVEEAPVAFLNREHELFKSPNKITENDFDNWVQERGLYFPEEWSDDYEALIGWNDPGEDMKKGALLAAEYGKGRFVYTGISFFRELPAGVPGAFRLFANIVSYAPQNTNGQNQTSDE
jgi:LmbE family N-acetylglucosaminyl deacetylase